MSCSSAVVARKKPQTGQDCISNLPDEVISLILSRLSTIEAVATSVLSRHWKYKWASLYSIDIDDEQLTEQSTYVDLLESIALHMRDVRRIRLKLSQKLLIPPGCNLLNIASLRDLVLEGPTLKLPNENCFANLTSLYLHDLDIIYIGDLDDYKEDMFTLNFPVLEKFEVSCCTWSGPRSLDIEIYAPALKTFKSKTRLNIWIDYYTINIHRASRLEEFYLEGGESEYFSLTGSQAVSAFFWCVLPMDSKVVHYNGLRIRKLLADLSPTLENLLISVDMAHAILISERVTHPLPRCDKLRNLTILRSTCIVNSAAVLRILHATPFLKSLNIDAMLHQDDDNDAVMVVPSCIQNSLEEIRLYNMMGTLGSFQIAQLLLKNAAKLKEFRVHCSCEDGVLLKEVKKYISSYPAASASIKFNFETR